MKKEDLSGYSTSLAVLSSFLLLMLLFTGVSYPLVIVCSIIAIYSGYLNFKNNKSKSVLVILIGLFCLYETSASYDSHLRYESLKSKPSYSGICFLGNSDTVALLYSDSPGDTYVKYTYSILDKKLTRQTKGTLNHNFNYSRDGKKIVFCDGDDVFIMNIDGNNKKKLTNHYNSKKVSFEKIVDGVGIIRESNVSPSFSPDGKYIIFVRQTFKHKKTEAMSLADPDCDIYEIDVETGKERQLTSYAIDGGIGYSRYFSDGKRLIFGAHGFSPKIDPKNRYFNDIFIIDDKNSTFNPKIMNRQYHAPSISFNDKIVFLYDEGSYRVIENVFIKSGDVVNRLTNMKSNIVSVEISSDGKFIIFEEHRIDHFDKHFLVMESDGRNLMEIIPPKE
jgi:Tol biopolymer transport system component